MKDKLFIIYIASILALIIPLPGRLAYGIILALTFNFLFFTTILLNIFIHKFVSFSIKWIITPIYFVFVVSFTKVLISIFSPILAMQLGLALYVQVFSVYMLNLLKKVNGNSIKEKLLSTWLQCVYYSIVVILFTLLRDVLGYGTITFPSRLGVYSIKLFPTQTIPLLNFFATMIGGTILSAIILFFINLIINKKEAKND